MAHFRGTVQGGRGTASRLGHKTTGLLVTASTWEHTVRTQLWYDAVKGEDWCSVYIENSDGTSRCLYSGLLSGKNPQEDSMPQPVFSLQELETAQKEIAGE